MGWIDRALQAIRSWLTPEYPKDEYSIHKGYSVPSCVRCGVEVKKFEERNVVDLSRPGDAENRIVRFGLICDSCLKVRGRVDGSG